MRSYLVDGLSRPLTLTPVDLVGTANQLTGISEPSISHSFDAFYVTHHGRVSLQ